MSLQQEYDMLIYDRESYEELRDFILHMLNALRKQKNDKN